MPSVTVELVCSPSLRLSNFTKVNIVRRMMGKWGCGKHVECTVEYHNCDAGRGSSVLATFALIL